MTTPTVIHSARIVDPDGVTSDGWIGMRGGHVSARGTGRSWRNADWADADVVDADGSVMTAGFIDLHCHGGGGESVTSDVLRVIDTHAQHGTTRLVASLVSAPTSLLCTQLAALSRHARTDGRLLGSHLEGPFLEQTHRGAHDPTVIRDACPREVDELVAAAGGTLVQVTLAPERPGAVEAIRAFRASGAVVAIGHTAAGLDDAREALRAGARLLTHTFNGMEGIHHRAPGPIPAALGDPDCVLEVISDGVHVHPDVVRLLFRLAPHRIALVTDAMAAAGSTDGDYRLGSLDVTVTNGVARVSDGGSIAGSTLTMDAALRHTVHRARVSLHDAVAAMTATPARTIGRDDMGRLAAGCRADAVLLSAALEVTAVWVDGRRVR